LRHIDGPGLSRGPVCRNRHRKFGVVFEFDEKRRAAFFRLVRIGNCFLLLRSTVFVRQVRNFAIVDGVFNGIDE
jgi:hypothetical protein